MYNVNNKIINVKNKKQNAKILHKIMKKRDTPFCGVYAIFVGIVLRYASGMGGRLGGSSSNGAPRDGLSIV